MRPRHASLFALIAYQSLTSACAQPGPMQPPVTKPPARMVEVQESRSSRSGPTRSLALGSASVMEIKSNMIAAPGTTPYGRARDPGSSKYSFTISTREHALSAECAEQANDAPYFGLGKASIDLYCTCAEGGGVRAALLLAEGRGEAALSSGERYAVWESHEDLRGHRVRPILGYRFRNPRQEGAIDISEQPRAYMPATLPAEHELPLACLYAALLLHTPFR
ncbi:MAG TPA: hypothetical protein VFZ61_31690 [Polyangiales bacterium]